MGEGLKRAIASAKATRAAPEVPAPDVKTILSPPCAICGISRELHGNSHEYAATIPAEVPAQPEQRKQPTFAEKWNVGICCHSKMKFDCASCLQGHAARMEQTADKAEANLAQLREALMKAQTLISAMETCHICNGLILVEEGPVYCQDSCSGDCEDHEEPNCPSLYDLHLAAKKAVNAALSGTSSTPQNDPREIAAACYQLAGVVGFVLAEHGAKNIPVRVLDALSAASDGKPFVNFLPVSPDEFEFQTNEAFLSLTCGTKELFTGPCPTHEDGKHDDCTTKRRRSWARQGR